MKNTDGGGIGGGVGFVGLLTLVFITLKLTDVIGWSWWWVLSPLIIYWGFALTIFAMIVFVILLREWNENDNT